MLGVGTLKDETVIGKDLTYLQLFNPPVHMIARGGQGGTKSWHGNPLARGQLYLCHQPPELLPAGGLFRSLTKVQLITACTVTWVTKKQREAGVSGEVDSSGLSKWL